MSTYRKKGKNSGKWENIEKNRGLIRSRIMINIFHNLKPIVALNALKKKSVNMTM